MVCDLGGVESQEIIPVGWTVLIGSSEVVPLAPYLQGGERAQQRSGGACSCFFPHRELP